MSTVFSIIAMCLLIAGLILAVKKPIQFTFFWSVLGCSYDGCGIVMYLDSCLGVYRFIMNYILLLCCVLSLVRFYHKRQTKTVHRFMATSFFFMLLIFISEVVVFITEGISIIANISYGFVEFGPVLFIIWLANYERFNRKSDSRNSILCFVSLQVVLAALIVYLPQYGIHTLDVFCGKNYISDGYIYNRNVLMNIFELPKMFVNKYLYNGLGQFHNSNDMGFYGTVGLLMAIGMSVKQKKVWKRVLLVGLAYLSLMLWGNSGMRGPVVGLICGSIIAYMLWKKPSKWMMGFLGITMVTVFLLSEAGIEFISYILPNSANISFTGRQMLRANGLEYLKHNWLIGAGGLIANLTSRSIDPHELPLRISCLFGIFAGILCILLVYVYPIMTFIKTRKKDVFTIIFWCIVFFVSITDNYTCIGLFWILFSEAICSMCYERGRL